MPNVSVIVPAYNAEETLAKTIEDLLAQTYDDFEIVLVDDGSTDGTPAICDEYKYKYDKIEVIHQKNGGLSNARNNGTRAAKGLYISYVDSDDRIDAKYIEYLMHAINETGADIAVGEIDRAREDQNAFSDVGEFSVKQMNTHEALQAMGVGVLSVGSCCKLARREIYQRHPFLERTLYEDLSNTYKVLMECNTVALVQVVLYHYVMRGGSITGRKKTTQKQCNDYYNAIKMCADTVVNEYPDLYDSSAVLRAKDSMALYLVIHRCLDKSKELVQMESEIIRWMKDNWRIVFKNNEAAVELRLRVLLFAISPQLYNKAYYIGIRFKGKAIS